MNVSLREPCIFAFGAFRLDPARRLLLRDGAPVSLPPRPFDTLAYLVAHAGRVVGHDELLRAVWDGRIVDDANVKQTIFTLRRALRPGGDGFIVTAPARGYRFAEPVRLESGPAAKAPEPGARETSIPIGRRRGLPGLRAASMAAIACLSGFAIVMLRAGPAMREAPPARSIAVLAFANLGGAATDAYLSDGLATELINGLGRIPGLRVAARTSAFSFRNSRSTATDIARTLNVGAVLEGTVQRAGPKLRVTADLVDATTGYAIWTRSYDRDSGDLLRIEADIAGAVVAALQVTMFGAGPVSPLPGGTDVPAAFDAFLRGEARADLTSDPGAGAAALPLFDAAIALDPNFASARAARAHALLVIANTGTERDPAGVRATLAEALAETRRALELAPGLGFAHLTRGAALMSVQDFRGADREIALAHALAPGDARITRDYAAAQMQFGRNAEGLAAAQQAAVLDPLAPGSYSFLASTYAAAHRYGDADNALRRARILGGAQDADAVERAIALARGDHAGALRSCAAGAHWRDMLCRAVALHGLGRGPEAEAEFGRLRDRLGDTGAYQYAEICAQWGRTEEALSWLHAALRLHDPGLVMLMSDPLMAPLRSTAGYTEILGLLGFPS